MTFYLSLQRVIWKTSLSLMNLCAELNGHVAIGCDCICVDIFFLFCENVTNLFVTKCILSVHMYKKYP